MERREPKIKVKLTDRMNAQIRNSLSMRKFNKENIDILKTFLSTGELPTKWSEQQKSDYKPNYDGFTLGDGEKFIFIPLHLEIIPDYEKENVLKVTEQCLIATF